MRDGAIWVWPSSLRRERRLVLATLALSLFAFDLRAARGDLQTFYFTGQVTNVVDGLGAFGPDAGTLATFSGSYTFDTSMPPLAQGDDGEAIYRFTAPPAGIAVQVGDFRFWTAPGQTDFRIIVRNEFGFSGSDEYGLYSVRNEAAGLVGAPQMDLLEIDWGSMTLENDPIADLSLPRFPPALAELGGGDFLISGECFACDVPNPTFKIQGTLTTLTSASGSRTGDLNADGEVDAADLAMLVGDFGSAATDGLLATDIDGDGRVGLADLMLLRANLSAGDATATDQSAAAVPEVAVSWIAMGGLATFWLRRLMRGAALQVANASPQR